MRSDIERQKAFADVFHDAMTEIGFFCKENTFYRCSKANQYVLEVYAEYFRDGRLYDISIGFGSNYEPIECSRKELSLNSYLGLTEYAAIFDDKIRRERQRMEDRAELPTISEYLKKTVLPAFLKTYAPMLRGINSLHDYLKAEEEFIERDCVLGYNIKGGACEQTALGYLALGDVESALRVCRKIPVYYRKYIQPVYEENGSNASGRVELIPYANRMIDSAIAMENQIASGSIEELLAQATERDAQSIEACTKFFGESLYLNS